MCPNKSCVAFTGPFKDLDECPICGASRWDQVKLDKKKKKVAAKTFCTIPIGSQIQAAFSSPESAEAMKYRSERTRQIVESAIGERLEIPIFEDFVDGSEYLSAYQRGDVKDDDVMLMLSLDGAQLYEHKMSDCWIYIWVILELSPDRRYKKHHVLPGGFIPGPHKPKNIDSFLFPGLYHIAALQREGLKVYDAHLDIVKTVKPYIALATADAPGMAYLSGLVGHMGANGCRNYCDVPSRHRNRSNHYYPNNQRPEGNYNADPHPDVDLNKHSPYFSQERYDNNLTVLTGSRPSNYEDNRRNTGISKQSIFSGLKNPFGVPGMFPLDLMHVVALNIPALFLGLFKADMAHDSALDDKSTWDWAVFSDAETWKAHGQKVTDLLRFLPSYYDRPPRNPAEKLTSGYKAAEFLVYFYGLLPALLINLLPQHYLFNFYKLVALLRIISKRSITREELEFVKKIVVVFLDEFETLYIQRREYRMHFARRCLHTLWHLASETARLGPAGIYAQWVLERTIGILKGETRLHSNIYSNLMERGVARGATNSLIFTYPNLFSPTAHHPQGTIHLGDGYLLLKRPTAKVAEPITPVEQEAYAHYARHRSLEVPHAAQIMRRGRLLLPNGHFVRTAWKEDDRPNGRTSRMIKIKSGTLGPSSSFGEVLYFFRLSDIGNQATTVCAMVSLCDPVEHDILTASYGVLSVCNFTRYKDVRVVEAHHIESVIGLLPFNPPPPGNIGPITELGTCFVLEDMNFNATEFKDTKDIRYKIIQEANEADLKTTKNPTYAKLYEKAKEMKSQLSELEKQLKEARSLAHEASHERCQESIGQLKGQLKEARSNVKMLSDIGTDKFLEKLNLLVEKNPFITRLKHPTKVEEEPKNADKIFWKEPETKSHPIFKDYSYFMDKNGTTFPKVPYREAMLASARGALTDAAIKTGSHFSTWRANGREFKEHFIASLEEAHPTLAQAQCHWKAIQVAYDHYPTWLKGFKCRVPIDQASQCSCGTAASRKRKVEEVGEPELLSGPGGSALKKVKTEASTFSKIQQKQIVNIFDTPVVTAGDNGVNPSAPSDSSRHLPQQRTSSLIPILLLPNLLTQPLIRPRHSSQRILMHPLVQFLDHQGALQVDGTHGGDAGEGFLGDLVLVCQA
ncbi:hypothetical protein NP233_g6715 [Leucocoprinus birnbaumii]|uniref:Uncharacterized protein n=1 Tax=Leucocoprinus birnbaumii TaxID=56174 RepID=A0AAD5YTF3_9AGAR|nr:hypothetical protein NP233_g6715 [Leucocoprinus birnbaumii]